MKEIRNSRVLYIKGQLVKQFLITRKEKNNYYLILVILKN